MFVVKYSKQQYYCPIRYACSEKSIDGKNTFSCMSETDTCSSMCSNEIENLPLLNNTETARVYESEQSFVSIYILGIILFTCGFIAFGLLVYSWLPNIRNRKRVFVISLCVWTCIIVLFIGFLIWGAIFMAFYPSLLINTSVCFTGDPVSDMHTSFTFSVVFYSLYMILVVCFLLLLIATPFNCFVIACIADATQTQVNL